MTYLGWPVSKELIETLKQLDQQLHSGAISLEEFREKVDFLRELGSKELVETLKQLKQQLHSGAISLEEFTKTVGLTGAYTYGWAVEHLDQQLHSGAISPEEYRETRDLLWKKRDDPVHMQNKFVRTDEDGMRHDEYCSCFTCARMNY